MALVCLSHIKHHFTSSAPALYEALATLTKIATPTFLLLSGFVAAYLLRGDTDRRLSIKLVDRGLFLLLVAHVLLGLADLPRISLFEWLFVRATITDAIGVAICVAVVLRAFSAGALLTLGIGLFAMSWVIGMTAVWDSEWANRLGALLFNLRSVPSTLVDVALLSYLGVFLIGMGLSSHLHRALTERDAPVLARSLSLMGACMISVSLLGVVAYQLAKPALVDSVVIDLVRATLDPRFKWPPSPAYLLFYGGVGVLMTGVFFYGRPRALVAPVVRYASVLGRASLMCFVVQDWLLFVTPEVFGFSGVETPAFWFAYFVATVLALYVLASAWGRVEGNRFLTIGLTRLIQRRASRRAALASGGSAAPARR